MEPWRLAMTLRAMVCVETLFYLTARWFNFACGANYPHQALKGGYFEFVWIVLS